MWISVLIAILAVVLACKGIAGLQEAGILGVPPLADLPRIEVLGLFPTTECVVAQIGAILVLVAGLWTEASRDSRRQFQLGHATISRVTLAA